LTMVPPSPLLQIQRQTICRGGIGRCPAAGGLAP
jgi:hypothetical protein